MKIFEEEYGYLKSLLDKEITKVIKKTEPKLLYDPSKYILASGGKRIRGVLLMMTARMFGVDYKTSIHAAVGVEILHLFTLVHDDIMDHADSRRGFQTVHKKWDENVAILTGDILIGIAFENLLKTKTDNLTDIIRIFNNAIIEVCEGQAYDKDFEKKDNITLDDYYLMIEKKTGKLIESSILIGAEIGNAGKAEIKSIKNYGTLIGKAFQIKDDFLDIAGNENEIGKKKYGDIYESKRTYFYCNALHSFNRSDSAVLRKVYNEDKKETADINIIVELYNKYNLPFLAKKEITALINKSITVLKPFKSEYKTHLENIANVIGKRKH
jgi:geranylgeranyl diphosphate synthase, type II